MKNDGFQAVIVTFVFGFLFILSFPLFGNVAEIIDFTTAPGINDTRTYQVDSNWNENGIINGLETDSDLLYPATNSGGQWTTGIIDVPRNRVLNLTYTADMRDGSGNITVNAWTDDPEGEPDDVYSINMTSGEETENIGFDQYNYFEAIVYMEENQGSDNKRPNLDSIGLLFEIVEEQKAGLTNDQVKPYIYLLWFLGITTLLVAVNAYIQR